MRMRRPSSAINSLGYLGEHRIVSPPRTAPSVAVWYVAVIAALLLVAAGVYLVYLHQQRVQWRTAANQLSIGQELLRADRDELLQKIRDHETELSTLQRQLSQRQTRLAALQGQRNQLQSDVAHLTRSMATAERQRGNSGLTNGQKIDLQTLEKELETLQRRLDQEGALLAERDAAIERLETSLDETDKLLVASRSSQRDQETLTAEARAQQAALEEETARSREKLVAMRRTIRLRQIVRGHSASLGKVKPYLAEVGPEYWQVIEGWLAQQLLRPMAVPDLSSYGWSYEGARLLVAMEGGPPMAMLLYADHQGKPISLTIARDSSGAQPLRIQVHAGLHLAAWRDERHAFVLAGETDELILQVVASALQDQDSKVASDSPVASSRFFRPEFRP